MYDLIEEVGEKSALLDKAIKAFPRQGKMLAQAEHDYRVALSKKVLLERDKGTPVTIISDVCRGDKEIARLRYERDVAETVYEAAKEAINGYKFQIRLLEAQISREWGNAGRN